MLLYPILRNINHYSDNIKDDNREINENMITERLEDKKMKTRIKSDNFKTNTKSQELIAAIKV